MYELVEVDRKDIELISNLESMGTWEDDIFLFDEHNSYDVWSSDEKYYKIYKDSQRLD